MASTYLTRTVSSSGSDTKGTISAWVKKSKLGINQAIICGKKGNTERVTIGFSSEDRFEIQFQDNTNAYNWRTNALYRDTSAWYNCVIQLDTGNATANSRARVWINGEEITSWGTQETVPQNLSIGFSSSSNVPHVGARGGSSVDKYFDGSMSHIHFTDGIAYDASAFGETDATTGEWVGKTSPSVTYGTNGFFILKDGNGITDQSGEGNDFTLGGGTLTDLKDNPDNVFCTANPLARYSGNLNYSNGNTTTTGSANDWTMGSSTMGASTGKWYYEYKLITAGTGSGYFKLGFISDEAFANNTGHIAESALDGGYAFYCQNGNLEVRTDAAVISGYSTSDLGVSFSMGDIMCLAVDMDNKRAYFRKNDDAWIKSANPVTGTNGLDISADYTAGKAMIPAFAIYYPGVASLNFGNGYFGTTAVASAGTNASGIGIFEYDVPTGYTALSTKGLNL